MSLDIFAAAREVPQRPFLIAEDGIYSYARMAELSAAAWRELRAAGAGQPGEGRCCVAWLATPSPWGIATLLALFAQGLPVAPLAATAPPAERAALVAKLQPQILLDELWRPPASSGAAAALPEPLGLSPEAPLAVVPTSGSTAVARLVVLSRRAFVESALASSRNLGWSPQDRWLLALPLTHVGGLSIVTRCLLARRSLVLAPQGLTAGRWSDFLAEQQVTLVSVVPTQLQRWLSAARWRSPPHLRALLLGGARAPGALLDRAHALGVPFLRTYGATEACSQITTQRYGERGRVDSGSGVPLAGVQLEIREGIIHVRSRSLLSGYWPDSPVRLTTDGYWKTADLGRLDARGNLHVDGRVDDIVVSGGQNIAPAEVEEVALRCSGVRGACAVGLPDDTWGQALGLAVAVEAPGDFDGATFMRALRARLVPHKLPKYYVLTAELPLGPSGKIQRHEVAGWPRKRWRPVPSSG